MSYESCEDGTEHDSDAGGGRPSDPLPSQPDRQDHHPAPMPDVLSFSVLCSEDQQRLMVPTRRAIVTRLSRSPKLPLPFVFR